MWWKILISVAAAYLIGSVSAGIIVSKTFAGIDIRKEGSGNIGMTNVMRTLGWFPSAVVLAGDALKGILAALIGKWLGGEAGMLAAGLAAVIGHNWPIWYNFKGGKGMSTSLGAIFVIDWRIALVLLGLQAVILLVTRTMSIASLATSLFYVGLTILWHNNALYIVFAAVMAAMAIFCHRSNIKRLAEKRENKLDFEKIDEISRKRMKK